MTNRGVASRGLSNYRGPRVLGSLAIIPQLMNDKALTANWNPPDFKELELLKEQKT